jgi:hypothetical protein
VARGALHINIQYLTLKGSTLLGLWEAGRLVCYAMLIAGTAMVVFFDRCGIALVLKQMPWNKGRENPQCKLPGAS